MKTIILAGGFGSRLDSITKIIPKPLVKVGKHPILLHILKIYLHYGYSDFILALGYKGDKIFEYFVKKKLSQSIKKKLKKGYKISYKIDKKNCSITFIETGLNSLTGGRLKKASRLIDEEDFFVTYGDGLADINIPKLLKTHKKNKGLVTVTAVNPPARFGELKIKKSKVLNFSEKKPIKQSWINGGFFVMKKKFIKLIKGDKTILERDPLEKATSKRQLFAYKHDGFWQCMDTKRDKDNLTKILEHKNFFFK
jgi:glucose-1-phosphate cytidylyltransferase|tara:strand:- start:790 stop:1548 length:759 start_codon:yes stop_codon:yes gene_type:complete